MERLLTPRSFQRLIWSRYGINATNGIPAWCRAKLTVKVANYLVRLWNSPSKGSKILPPSTASKYWNLFSRGLARDRVRRVYMRVCVCVCARARMRVCTGDSLWDVLREKVAEAGLLWLLFPLFAAPSQRPSMLRARHIYLSANLEIRARMRGTC